MDYSVFSFISIQLVIFYIYGKIYKFALNKEKNIGSKWISAIGVTIGLFVIVIYTFDGWAEFDDVNDYGIGYPICVTFLMWLFGHYLLINKDLSSPFKSEDGEFHILRKFKEVSKIDAELITTYPRVTVWNLGNEIDTSQELIFDSSDFTIINNFLGVISNCPLTISKGYKFKIQDKCYLVENVEIKLYDLFDDYSQFGHTEVYQGKSTPYNLQIVLMLHLIKEGTNN